MSTSPPARPGYERATLLPGRDRDRAGQEVRRADPRLLRVARLCWWSKTRLPAAGGAAHPRETRLSCADGARRDAALLVLAEPGRTVDLILTDIYAEIRRRRPVPSRHTGDRTAAFPCGEWVQCERGDGRPGTACCCPFIKKPWTLEEILGAVRKALDAPLPARPNKRLKLTARVDIE